METPSERKSETFLLPHGYRYRFRCRWSIEYIIGMGWNDVLFYPWADRDVWCHCGLNVCKAAWVLGKADSGDTKKVQGVKVK